MAKIIKNFRIWLLVIFLLISLMAINPQFNTDGVAVRHVLENSNAFNAGLKTPSKETSQVNFEKITKINNQEIKTIEDYNEALNSINLNSPIIIETNKKEYSFEKDSEDLGLTIQKPESSNLKKGLDLQGGTRVLLQPKEEATSQEIEDVISIMDRRLNTLGLTDLEIRSAKDLDNNQFILIEIAGVSQDEIKEIITSQGLFEAKITNQTVFTGGKEDISFVCRNDGSCSGITQCFQQNSEHICNFEFRIDLTTKAAKKHAELTQDLEVITEGNNQYLSEKIQFFLDGEFIDELNIGSSLKGVEATSIVISGPGIGESEEEALEEAEAQMNKLQTVLLTGSLPIELEIVKLDTISPSLGNEFIENAILSGLLAILAVSIVIFIRYRKLQISLPMIFFTLSEVFIILGFSALLRYNLDLAAIAGIIAAVGTGIDDQIIIIDETLNKSESQEFKRKLKRAFFIITVAYITTVAAMIPLFSAGAGLIRGFALITIIGVSIGVFLTRPAFAAVIKKFNKE